MAYPKCKHCGHSKTKHWERSDYLHPICRDCVAFYNEGPLYAWEIDKNADGINMYHKYLPDNLTYIEKLAERKGLV